MKKNANKTFKISNPDEILIEDESLAKICSLLQLSVAH
jgi:hypothetical protein